MPKMVELSQSTFSVYVKGESKLLHTKMPPVQLKKHLEIVCRSNRILYKI